MLGHSLSNVPQLNDSILLKAEDVDYRPAPILWVLPHAREHSDTVTPLDCELNLQTLVRVHHRILLHCCLQGSSIAVEIRIVMTETSTDVLFIGITDVTRSGQLQKIHGGIFV